MLSCKIIAFLLSLQNGFIFVYSFNENGYERMLKGGGGGGSSYSGGGAYGYNSGNNHNNSGNSKIPIGVIIMMIAFPIFGILACICICKKKATQLAKQTGENFEKQVIDAKTNFKDELLRSSGTVSGFKPKSGLYNVIYIEEGREMNAETHLNFTLDKIDNCYTLSGKSKDADGETQIMDGRASLGGKAWWKERNISGSVGMQVLNTGTFNYQDNTFQGRWSASTGVSGSFKSFLLVREDANSSNDLEEGVGDPIQAQPVINAYPVEQSPPIENKQESPKPLENKEESTSIFDALNFRR